MKRFISKAADATSAEGPKLTIDLAKIFGFTPLSLEIPLPKLSNPFASKVVDPLALPFKRWRVRLRAWTDARRGLGSASDVQLTGYETEILAHQDRKLLELEKATQEHRLTVRQALKSVEAQSFDAGDAVRALKNRFLDWLAACEDNLRQVRDRHAKAKSEADEKERALDELVNSVGLRSRVPHFLRSPPERWADITIAASVDIALSFWFISVKPEIDRVQAIGLSSVTCLINISVGFIIGKYVLHRAKLEKSVAMKAILIGIAVVFTAAICTGNVLFAFWRDLGATQATVPSSPMGLSAFSFLLLTLNLAIYTFMVLKTIYEFNPAHPGHEERWRDFKLAEAEASSLRLLHEQQLQHMRWVGYASVERVRQDAGGYLQHLKTARLAVSTYLDNLSAHSAYWPKLFDNVQAFAEALIKVYREQLFSSSRRHSEQPRPVYPSIPPRKRSYDTSDEDVTTRRALALLADAETEMKRFQNEFESVVAPMVRQRIDAEAKLVLESTATATP
ncbi:MAG: hypothetical protein A2711_06505 [Burkholderiales bacterium RIFCSPHIGHO2_01_FULL_63_240]|jgi:hypothetical protein|nr:MAG: hypothetical protein A2711_06505 [Burkholderiales bacterium RIFCSPHIGHO2_01_FULL_63_240]